MQTTGFCFTTIAVASACTLAAPAGAQLATHNDLAASIAITIVQTAIEIGG